MYVDETGKSIKVFSKKIRDYLGIFPNVNPKTFVNLPSNGMLKTKVMVCVKGGVGVGGRRQHVCQIVLVGHGAG